MALAPLAAGGIGRGGEEEVWDKEIWAPVSGDRQGEEPEQKGMMEQGHHSHVPKGRSGRTDGKGKVPPAQGITHLGSYFLIREKQINGSFTPFPLLRSSK